MGVRESELEVDGEKGGVRERAVAGGGDQAATTFMCLDDNTSSWSRGCKAQSLIESGEN